LNFNADTQHHIRGEELDHCVPAAHRFNNVFPQDQRGHNAAKCPKSCGSNWQYTAAVAIGTAAAANAAATTAAAVPAATATAIDQLVYNFLKWPIK